jgi:SNF2 family DNA or RNA helicase
MIELKATENALLLRSHDDDFRPRHESQLAFWGFSLTDGWYAASSSDGSELASKVVAYLQRERLPLLIDEGTAELLKRRSIARQALLDAYERCRQFKSGAVDKELATEFTGFAKSKLSRTLKRHQVKAALHLLSAVNGANFSVPGSGKTTVVLAVFAWLKAQGIVDSLFVVGPPACFDPWQLEYEAVLGHSPRCQMLAGGDINERRSRYLIDASSVSDLYLTTFQTLQRDWQYVRRFLDQRGVRFFLVVDEAHYIKQTDGVWSEAVLGIAKHAERRCILTGTPFPRAYSDAYNLFDVLWPEESPLSSEHRSKIERFTHRKEPAKAAQVLSEAIGPLFYRVRKSDLGLAPQIFHAPILVPMRKYERLVYDSIIERIRYASQSDFFRDFDLLVRLRRGRMVRLRQCVSYTALLTTAVQEYNEELIDDPSVADIIRHYDSLEVPAKLETLIDLISTLRNDGHKIVIWSNFIKTLQKITDSLRALGHGVELVFGGTPFERASVNEELTRERIIRRFKEPKSGLDVLVANPAACAESISLHTACSYSVYFDMSYNCAQYLQSLDRIHRVGGSEEKPANYYTLQYEDTIDLDILSNLRAKADNMSVVIDDEYPVYSLDMFNDDDELEAYERLFGKRAKSIC